MADLASNEGKVSYSSNLDTIHKRLQFWKEGKQVVIMGVTDAISDGITVPDVNDWTNDGITDPDVPDEKARTNDGITVPDGQTALFRADTNCPFKGQPHIKDSTLY